MFPSFFNPSISHAFFPIAIFLSFCVSTKISVSSENRDKYFQYVVRKIFFYVTRFWSAICKLLTLLFVVTNFKINLGLNCKL